MARSGVTYTEVAQAAIQLQTESKNPTVEAIRSILGTGSQTTIARHLKQWKQSVLSQGQAPSLPAALVESVQGLWQHLQNEANHAISRIQMQAQGEMQVAHATLEALSLQHTQLNAQYQAQTVNLKQAQQQIEELTALHQSLHTESIRKDEQIYGLERQCNQQAEENQRLHAALKQTQDNLLHYQEANLRLKEAHALEQEKERQGWASTQKALETDNRRLNEERATLLARLTALEAQLAQSAYAIEQMESKCEKLTSDSTEKGTKIAVLQQKEASLLQQCNKQDAKVQQLQQALQAALSEVHLQAHTINHLHEQHSSAQDKIQQLSDEKAFLAQEKMELVMQVKLLHTSSKSG